MDPMIRVLLKLLCRNSGSVSLMQYNNHIEQV